MEASDWVYVVEGGRHALFSTHRHSWQGKLLRVRKQDLRDSSTAAARAAAAAAATKEVATEYPSSPSELRSTTATTSNQESQQAIGRPDFFIQHVVAPWLTPFFDVPEKIRLEWTFLCDLASQTIHSSRIPPSRRKDWYPKTSLDSTTNSVTPSPPPLSPQLPQFAMGTLVVDYRSSIVRTCPSSSPSLGQTANQSASLLTIEIKPKAGYLAWSPLVDPLHRQAKFRASRFVSLQRLHQKGVWNKGWAVANTNQLSSESEKRELEKRQDATTTTKRIRMSQYDPLDFFAMVSLPETQHQACCDKEDKRQRVRRAIINLLHSPQNNLRCFFNQNIMIVGHLSNTDDEARQSVSDNELCMQVLHDLFPNLKSSGENYCCDRTARTEMEAVLEDIMLQVITSDLGKELLSKLLAWQKLDVLDVDGVVLVYCRFVALLSCKASLDNTEMKSSSQHLSAQECLDNITMQDLKPIHSGFSDDTPPIQNSGDEVCPLLAQSPFAFGRDSSSNSIVELCKEVESFQMALSKEWPELPSKGNMDEARQRSLAIVEELTLEECRFLLLNWLLSLSMCDVSIFVVLKAIPPVEATEGETTDDDPTIRISFGHTTTDLTYHLQVIDTDQKPARKLQQRQEKESVFSLLG